MRSKLETAAVILLAALLALSIYNIHYINRLTGELCDMLGAAESMAESGEYEKAAERVVAAAEQWRSRDFYTHVTIRHSEVDGTTDMFYELVGYLREENAGDSSAGFERLRARLTSLRDMERVSFKSVL